MGIIFCGKGSSKGEHSKGNFTHGGEFAKIPTQIYFYLSCFLFSDSILHVEILREIDQGKHLLGWNCLEYLSVGGGIFCTRVPQNKSSRGNFLR